MGAVVRQTEAEAGSGSGGCCGGSSRGKGRQHCMGLDVVMSQAGAEAEAAVGLDAVMSHAEAGAEAGSSGDGCCDEPG